MAKILIFQPKKTIDTVGPKFSIFGGDMANSLERFYKNQSLIYKYILYFISVGLIVFFFPREGKFKYEFQKGRSWQYDNLYAPFDFSINKTKEELDEERSYLTERKAVY
ncbi:MAG: hypothetical protein ACFB0A_16415 [Croceivirga sp.]